MAAAPYPAFVNGYTVGVDVGTTSIKAVLYSLAHAAPVRVASAPLPARLELPPGHVAVDVEQVCEVTENVIREVASDEAVAICFTGQMHGGLVTGADDRPLTPFITWEDRRTQEAIADIRSRAPLDAWNGVGCPLNAGFLGATVCWLVEHGDIPPDGWRLGGVYETVACRLLGVAPYTDQGSAAAWGLFDIVRGCWSEDAVRACHIPLEALPRVLLSGLEVGTVSAESARTLGLAAGIPVICGAGDTQASFLGSGCRPNELLVNFGTGSQLMWERKAFERWPSTDVRALISGRFLLTVPTLAGGAAYARLASFFTDVIRTLGGVKVDRDLLYARMGDAAGAAAEDAGGVVASSLFSGSRWLGEELRASVGGLDRTNFTAGNVCRAMLSAMVDELAQPYFALPADVRPHNGVVGSGNGLRRNPVLRQIVTRRFGMGMRLSAHEEEAAIGAAMIATWFLADRDRSDD